MKKELSVQEALCKAESYCSSTEHCISEVEAKLVLWGLPVEEVSQVIEKLQEERFINEQRFANAFVRDKYRFNQWGRIKIRQHLKLKKLSEEMIQVALDEIDESEYQELLTGQLERKSRTVKARNGYEKNGKLIRFAVGRGYEVDEVVRCLKQITDDEIDMD